MLRWDCIQSDGLLIQGKMIASLFPPCVGKTIMMCIFVWSAGLKDVLPFQGSTWCRKMSGWIGFDCCYYSLWDPTPFCILSFMDVTKQYWSIMTGAHQIWASGAVEVDIYYCHSFSVHMYLAGYIVDKQSVNCFRFFDLLAHCKHSWYSRCGPTSHLMR